MVGVLSAGLARADDDGAAPKPVKLPTAIQAKLGLKTQTLAPATNEASRSGYVRVLDAGPLAQLDSDIRVAIVTAQASASEAARSKALNADGQTVSSKALEAAQAQAQTDAARLALLRRRLGLEWGEGVARLSDARRDQLLAAIGAQKAVLIRIDTPSGQGLAGLRQAWLDFGPLGGAAATVLGAAHDADPHLLSAGLLAEVGGPMVHVLGVGLTLPVTLKAASGKAASGGERGVVAPSVALIRSQGQTWVYVRTGPDSFLRKAVTDGRADPAGLFVASGLKAGDRVVTQGAAALFAAETHAGADDGG